MKAIIYKDWGIRAMLADKKLMTRRLMYPQPPPMQNRMDD